MLIGWNAKNGSGQKGIFGIPIAVGDTCEEQSRYTLHSHICVWVENFNNLCDMMFDGNMHIRQVAQDEMLKYFKLVGQASLGDMKLFIPDDVDKTRWLLLIIVRSHQKG